MLRKSLGIGGLVLLSFATDGARAADLTKLAKLEQFEPSINEIKCGGEFSLSALMTASPDETVDYFGILTVNGMSTAPFTLTLLPGDVTVRERIRWPIRVRGKTVSLRFRFIVVSKDSKIGHQIAEVSKDYNLGSRKRSGYTGC